MTKKLSGKEIKRRILAIIIVIFIGFCIIGSALMHMLKLNLVVEKIDKKSAIFIRWLEKFK